MATTSPVKSRLSLMSSAAFARKNYRRGWLVENILVTGQPCVVGGPIKCMKTSLVIDLAISLGSGTPFLGRFAVPEAKTVAVFSGESGAATIQETAIRIAKSRSLNLASDCRVHWGFSLPRLSSTFDLEELAALIKLTGAVVVVIDPLYLYLCLCLPAGGAKVSASNLFEVGPLLAAVSDLCSRLGATLIIVHHATKTASGNKKRAATTLNDLAFAGISEFARQWLLINRRTEYQAGSGVHDLVLSAGGRAGHSSQWQVQIDEGVFNADERNTRGWQVSVEPDRMDSQTEPNEDSAPRQRLRAFIGDI